jgi:hypothetical protein
MNAGRVLMLVLVAGVVAGCGSGPTFTAEELIAAVNEHGGGLNLGSPLASADEGVEAHTLSFTDTASAPADVHAGGSVLIAEDDDTALAEYQRCERAASLICFRAANAVLMFEDSVPNADLVRVREAIRALGSE